MNISKKKLLIILVCIAILLTILGFVVYFTYFIHKQPTSNYIGLNNRNESIINTVESETDISKYLGKKNLLIFWASWCSFCKDDLPNVLSVENEEKYKDVNFIYISHDRELTELQDFITLNKYNMFILYDTDKLIRTKLDPSLTGIPCFYLLDENGNIIGKNRGTINKDELEEFLDTNGKTGNATTSQES